MQHRRLKPYRQGQMDGLCGLYALINAIRLILADTALSDRQDHWNELFCELMAVADDAVGTIAVTVGGMCQKPYTKLLRCAVQHMANEHEIAVTITPLLASGFRCDGKELCGRIAATLQTPNRAVIALFEGSLDHWTVIRRATPTALELFDSIGLVRVRTENVRMSYEKAKADRREHIVRRDGVFVVASGDGRHVNPMTEKP